MSDTPRTDEQELAMEGIDGTTYVHSTFARELERENARLRAALEDILRYTDAGKHSVLARYCAFATARSALAVGSASEI